MATVSRIRITNHENRGSRQRDKNITCTAGEPRILAQAIQQTANSYSSVSKHVRFGKRM